MRRREQEERVSPRCMSWPPRQLCVCTYCRISRLSNSRGMHVAYSRQSVVSDGNSISVSIITAVARTHAQIKEKATETTEETHAGSQVPGHSDTQSVISTAHSFSYITQERRAVGESAGSACYRSLVTGCVRVSIELSASHTPAGPPLRGIPCSRMCFVPLIRMESEHA